MEDQHSSKDSPFFIRGEVKKGKETLSPQQVIRSLCRVRAWKLTDLAREVGISKQALNHYLHGWWVVPTAIKIKIAQALEVDSSAIWDLEKKNV